MLFFQIYGELQSLMFTETGLVWVLRVKKLLWHTLGYPYASEVQVWLIHLSYHTSTWSLWFQSKTIPISWTSLHRHAAFGQQQLWRICQGQLSCPSAMGQLCCTAAQTYPFRMLAHTHVTQAGFPHFATWAVYKKQFIADTESKNYE